MALQTKKFSWGSFDWKSASNSYVLELTLTENATNLDTNQSSISYELVLKSGSNNRFQGDVKSELKLNGVTAATNTENKYLDFNSKWTLLKGTTNVTHNQDGSLSMPIEVNITTYNSYAPPNTTQSWSWDLTKIPRASTITSVGNVTLGGSCSVKWTPNSKDFRYKLTFTCGSWSGTTGAIHPNKVSPYTYTGYTLPMEAASQITNSKTGKMQVVLTAYADAACSKLVGSSAAKEITATVPENASTRPTAKMTLTLVDGYNGNYLQGLSKVKVDFSDGSAKYDASVKNYGFTVQNVQYSGNGQTSKFLTTVGNLKVVGTVTDSRGITGTMADTITVAAYFLPKLQAKAYRCGADGTANSSGEYLKIEAVAEYASINGNLGASLKYRYRKETKSQYGAYITISSGVASGSKITTSPNNIFPKENAYVVQVVATDKVGKETVNTIRVAGEQVFLDKPAGGRRLGVGGYAGKDDRMDVHWDMKVYKGLNVDGGINGIYIRKAQVQGTKEIRIQTKFTAMNGEGDARQSIFLFGFANGVLISGVVGVSNSGSCKWEGTESVDLITESNGKLIITLPLTYLAYDPFVFISADEFTVL